jgi:TolA-binding protein
MKGPFDGADAREAVVLAKELPTRVPDRSRRDEVRATLLASAAAEPVGGARRSPWIVGIVALGAAAAVALVIARARPPMELARSRVVVHARPGTRYTVVSPPPWETFHLAEGAIELDVEPLGPRERVRVETGDGEVEVRGTRFEVTAREDRLVGVAVTHGRVEVRPRGMDATVLGAGQRWLAPTPLAASAPRAELGAGPGPMAPPTAPPDVAEHAAPTRRTPFARARRLARAEAAVEALEPTRQEVLYDDAWDALRAQQFEAAAAGFARVLAEAPVGPLADEAAFWRATALARGGAPDKARAAFGAYLSKYRASARRGEAAAILGWLLVDAHRAAEAAPLFRVAADDPRDSVRASGREGLAAVAGAPKRR